MTKPNSPAKDRRHELVLIAFHHIAHRGFEGLRIHDVAGEAGINNATLHYYFPTKEDLVKGVVDYMVAQFSASFFSAGMAEGHPGAWEVILADLEDARQRPRQDPEQLIVYTELLLRSIHDPSIATVFEELDKSWRGFLAGVIERGIREGVFRKDLDPRATATLLMIQIKGMGLQAFAETNREIGDDVFDQLIRQTGSWLDVSDGRPSPDSPGKGD